MELRYSSYGVSTSHGMLHVKEVGQSEGQAILFIHGNSFCKDVFRKQMVPSLGMHFRLVSFDLPGHGRSQDARDPERTYTRTGLADASIELLEKLRVSEAIVVGWSLGGHVAMEMMQRFGGLRGVFTAGAPAVPRGQMGLGFAASPAAGLAAREVLSEAECAAFVDRVFGASAEPFLVRAVARTDGRFRRRLFEAARAGEGLDQREAVETSSIPLAVVNGAEDGIVNLDYVDEVDYANLWGGRCLRVPKAGHAVFWQSPDALNATLLRFAQEVAA